MESVQSSAQFIEAFMSACEIKIFVVLILFHLFLKSVFIQFSWSHRGSLIPIHFSASLTPTFDTKITFLTARSR